MLPIYFYIRSSFLTREIRSSERRFGLRTTESNVALEEADGNTLQLLAQDATTVNKSNFNTVDVLYIALGNTSIIFKRIQDQLAKCQRSEDRQGQREIMKSLLPSTPGAISHHQKALLPSGARRI
mgnify:CR=1 FL=1